MKSDMLLESQEMLQLDLNLDLDLVSPGGLHSHLQSCPDPWH